MVGGQPGLPSLRIPWVVVRILGMVHVTGYPNSCYGHKITPWRPSTGTGESPRDLFVRILFSDS